MALKRAEAEGGGEAAWCDVFGVFLPCMIVLPLHRRVGVSALSSSEFMNPHVVVAAGRARDGAPTLPLESNGERKRSLFISYYSRMMRRALPLAATCILQGDMKKVGRNATTREAREGGREEGRQRRDAESEI